METVTVERLMNAQQVADYLNVKKNTIRIWSSAGKIPVVKLGRSARYRLDAINRWINKNTKQAVNCLVLASFLLISTSAHAEYSNDRIADAIYKVENSVKYPYGIKSINTHGNKVYARRICINSIKGAKRRWMKAGKPGDLITHMGKRYSPPKNNPNWVRLVKWHLAKGR
jgi:excisionase family DNA binding protein